MKNEPQNRVIYIFEDKLLHWTTVEPLIVLFQRKGWDVSIFADEKFEAATEKYLKVHGQSKSSTLKFFDVRKIFPFWRAIFRAPDLCVVSDSYLYTKSVSQSLHSSSLLSVWMHFLRFWLSRNLFLHFVARRSFLIKTTHFVDVVEPHEKLKSGVTFIDYATNKIWRKADSKVSAINVYSSLVAKHHVQAKTRTVLVAPNALYRPHEGHFKVKKYEKVRIVIPGRIDNRRRTYDWIQPLPETLSKQLDIVMVGKTQSVDDFEFVRSLTEKGFEQLVENHNFFIPFDVYDTQLYSADILFVPLRKLDHPNRAIDRNLGSFFDAIRYGKGIILPNNVTVPPELEPSVLKYKTDEDLLNIFRRLSEDQGYLAKLKVRFEENSKLWSAGQGNYVDHVIGLAAKQ